MSAEGVLFWLGTVLYAVSALLLTAGLVFRRQRLADIAFYIAIAGLVAHTGTIAARGMTSGRLPYVDDYENVLAGVWFIAALYVGVGLWRPSLRATGIVALPFVLLTLGYSLTVETAIGPVTPPHKSIWLAIHVLFAWAAYSAYTVCAAVAAIELLKTSKRGIRPGSILERTPDVPALQDLTFRLVAFGFLVNGVMIASGAIWAYELWGSYWRWDPVETWSLLTWLAFGFYMHAHLTLGWRGRKLAWIPLGALFGVFMMFWGVQLAPSLLGTQYHMFRDMGELLEESSRAR